MKKLSILLLLSVFIFTGCNDDEKNSIVISLNGKLTEANTEFVAADGEEHSQYAFKTTFTDASNMLRFDHYFNIGSKTLAGGFTYINKTDVTTPGYTNNSAITGKGKYGQTYITSYVTSWNPAKMVLLKPENYIYKGAWVTNSVYAYLAIKDANTGGMAVKKFDEGDWFKLTAVGYNADNKSIGKVEIYLADFRNGKKEIINNWVWFDFSPISNAEYIMFEMSSTDNDPTNGMNTPAYFCMDGITLQEK